MKSGGLRQVLVILCFVLTLLTGASCATVGGGPRSESINVKSDEPTDTQITAFIQNKINRDRVVAPSDVVVTCKDHVARLTGTARSLRAKDRTLMIVQNTRGVQSVIDEVVLNAPQLADSVLETRILSALAADGAMSRYKIKVHVDHGRAFLTGLVDFYGEKALAEWVVKGVAGIQGLQNDLLVNTNGHVNDQQLAVEVRELLATDPWIDSWDIKVQAVRGQVFLAGNVNSPEEQRRAILAVFQTGATRVDGTGIVVRRDSRGISSGSAGPSSGASLPSPSKDDVNSLPSGKLDYPKTWYRHGDPVAPLTEYPKGIQSFMPPQPSY